LRKTDAELSKFRHAGKASHHLSCIHTIVPTIADKASNDGAVLLLDKSLIALLVGPRASLRSSVDGTMERRRRS